MKVLLVVIVVGVAGYFVVQSMHTNPGNKGQVINTASNAQNVATTVGAQGTMTQTEQTDGTTCTITFANSANPAQSITVAGTAGAEEACVPNAKQANSVAQGMAAAMQADTAAAKASQGGNLVFAEQTTVSTCTITVSSATNSSQSIAVAGTAANGVCTPNAKQANAVSQGMAQAMMSGN